MKTLNLALGYKIGEKDIEQDVTPAKVTMFIVAAAVADKFPRSMERTDSRMWVKVQDATEDVEDAVLEDSMFDWLHDVVKEFKPTPTLARWYWILMDHLDELKDKKEE